MKKWRRQEIERTPWFIFRMTPDRAPHHLQSSTTCHLFPPPAPILNHVRPTAPTYLPGVGKRGAASNRGGGLAHFLATNQISRSVFSSLLEEPRVWPDSLIRLCNGNACMWLGPNLPPHPHPKPPHAHTRDLSRDRMK